MKSGVYYLPSMDELFVFSTTWKDNTGWYFRVITRRNETWSSVLYAAKIDEENLNDMLIYIGEF